MMTRCHSDLYHSPYIFLLILGGVKRVWALESVAGTGTIPRIIAPPPPMARLGLLGQALTSQLSSLRYDHITSSY